MSLSTIWFNGFSLGLTLGVFVMTIVSGIWSLWSWAMLICICLGCLTAGAILFAPAKASSGTEHKT